MRIDSSSLNFNTSHQAWQRTLDLARSPSRTAALAPLTDRPRMDSVELSSAARRALDAQAADGAEGDPVTALIKSMVEMITGEAIRVFSNDDLPPLRQVPALGTPSRAGTPTVEQYHLHEEYERLDISTEALIRTADGQEIHVTLDLTLERYYREETLVSSRPDPAPRKDPLVLNFAGPAAQLADRWIRFDLDGDGALDDLPALLAGSAYLTLDRNGNGVIDNGLELFGPATDEGFAELARLDADGNGWIDEADPLFGQLGVWNPGENELRSLADAGVGALALAHTAAPFALRSADNRDLGASRQLGLYLTEQGRAGSLQEIDLSVG